jgi:hypothetical protein
MKTVCVVINVINIFVLKRENKTQKQKTNVHLLIWMPVIHKLFMPLKHDLYTSSYPPEER